MGDFKFSSGVKKPTPQKVGYLWQIIITVSFFEPNAGCHQISLRRCHFFSDFEQLHRADFIYSEAKILTHYSQPICKINVAKLI